VGLWLTKREPTKLERAVQKDRGGPWRRYEKTASWEIFFGVSYRRGPQAGKLFFGGKQRCGGAPIRLLKRHEQPGKKDFY